MPAAEREEPHGDRMPRRAAPLAGPSVRDLLASCAAAAAVSTPPRRPAPAPDLAEEAAPAPPEAA
ncbi:hypothetical protein ACIQUQ_12495 [Streptomyces sp. NPDC101118]|uniref:hypothetical protein n=1 Tax=Streptomyces sp. NPDC101118 TaxID=3366109 RepID=UPI0037F84C6C